MSPYKRIINGIHEKDWTYYGLWKQPLFSAYAWVEWFDQAVVQDLGVTISSADTIVANGHFLVKNSVIQQFDLILSDVITQENTTFSRHLLTRGKHILQESVAKSSELSASSAFQKFISIIKRAMAPWYVSCQLSFCLERYLQEVAKQGITYADILSSLPQRETLVMKQHREAMEIKKILHRRGLLFPLQNLKKGIPTEIIGDSTLWKKIISHVEEYAWMGIGNYVGQPYTLEQFLSSLSNISENQPKRSPLTVPSNLLFIPQLAQDIGFLRQYSAEMNALLEYQLLPFLQHIAGHLSLSYQELLRYTPEEVRNLLFDHKNISSRKEDYALFLIQDKEVVVESSQDVAALLGRFVPQADKTKQELQGQVACKGHAKGRASILRSPEDFAKMRPGNILVTTMTTPEYVPLMHQAAAIVTDIGGLLSHAAIVSRELGKPCIIGTTFATTLFKDGDYLDVDAENGIIRKTSPPSMILPTPPQCLDFFAQYKVPQNVKQHCMKVQEVAVFLAKALKEAGTPINGDLIRAGSILHDLFKAVSIDNSKSDKWNRRELTEEEIAMRDHLRLKYGKKFENEIAYEVFKDKYPELAIVLRNEGDPYLRQRTWEESIIHYADYRVFQESIVSLQDRFAYFREAYPAKEGFWEEYFAYCQAEERKIFQQLPFSPAELAEQMIHGR